MVKLTPQEKKTLSYAKDRRNNYGENDKSSRKNIPANKARVNRSYRRKVNDVLQVAPELTEAQGADVIEDKVASVKREFWRKYPDAPLGQIVKQQKEWREKHAGNGKTAQRKIAEFEKNLKIEVEQEEQGRWRANAIDMKGVQVSGETEEDAVRRCRRLAHAIFIEAIGAGEAAISEDFLIVERY